MTHYIVVRSDLPIGFILAQVTHAAGESSSGVPPGTNAVVLEVNNESELLKISEQLQERNIKHRVIKEVDPPFTGQHTAIGLEPVQSRELVKKVLSRLPLFGKRL